MPRERRERELTLLVEPLERELGRGAAGRPRFARREVAALVGDERPDEQDEEQRDEPDRDALRDELGPARDGQ